VKKDYREKIALYVQNVGVEKASLMAETAFVTHPESIIEDGLAATSRVVPENKCCPAPRRIAELYYYSMVLEYLYADEDEVYSELKKIIDDNSRNS